MRSTSACGCDALDRRFRRRVDIEHVHAIGLMKGAREIVHQRLRARVAVRLEQHVNASKAAGARGRERGANLGGVMAVVVDHGDAALRAAHLKAAVHAAEMPPALRESSRRECRVPAPTATAAVAFSTLCAPGTCRRKQPRSRRRGIADEIRWPSGRRMHAVMRRSACALVP